MAGTGTVPLRYLGLGQAAAFGMGRGVAELYRLPFTGWVAWVVRLAFFIRFMPSRANALETVTFLMARRSAVPSAARFSPGPAPETAPARYAAVSTAVSRRAA
jgi:NADH dehydrogenase